MEEFQLPAGFHGFYVADPDAINDGHHVRELLLGIAAQHDGQCMFLLQHPTVETFVAVSDITHGVLLCNPTTRMDCNACDLNEPKLELGHEFKSLTRLLGKLTEQKQRRADFAILAREVFPSVDNVRPDLARRFVQWCAAKEAVVRVCVLRR